MAGRALELECREHLFPLGLCRDSIRVGLIQREVAGAAARRHRDDGGEEYDSEQ
jgi:hypothetical protein